MKQLLVAACLALAGPAAGQVLPPLDSHVLQLVETIYRQQNPSFCVTAFHCLLGHGAEIVETTGFPCNGFATPRQGYLAVEAQAAALRLRDGYFFYVWSMTTSVGFLVPYVLDPLPACCLVPYRTTENRAWLLATGSTARGVSFQLQAGSAQSSAALTTGFVSLASGSVSMRPFGSTLMIDPTSLVATFPFLPPVAGVASATLPVPNSPQLVGLDLYVQAAHFDLAVMAEPVRLTNGLIATIT